MRSSGDTSSRAQAHDVPGSKPRLYYRAVRAHERLRLGLWRQRSGAKAKWSGVRIFGYHRVTTDDDVFAITPNAFRRQMALLEASDVSVIPLREAIDVLERGDSGRYVAITFDDAYRDTLEQALPILESFEFPATVYAVVEVLEGARPYSWYRSPPAALAVDDLPQLFASGLIDVQSHSVSHARLTALTDAQLHAEVAGSKARLEQYVPYELTSFCYPAGIYGAREAAAVRAAGFRAAVTTHPGVNTSAAELGELRRTMIYWGDGKDSFSAKLAGGLDQPSRAARYLHARRARSFPAH